MTVSQYFAAAAGLLFIGTVASPVVRNWQRHPKDDFPLSHYPMFSAKRRSTGKVVHVLAEDATGEHNVSYRRIGDGGFNQIRRQIAKRAQTPQGATELAREVYHRLRTEAQPADRVRVVRSTFCYDKFFAGERAPIRVRDLGAWGDQR